VYQVHPVNTSDSLPLEPSDSQHCEAALGYTELGMFDDANAELECIDPFTRAVPEVLRVRAAIYHGLKKWDALLIVAARLTEFEPANVQWTISLAYATRRVASIQAARGILLAAEANFPSEAIIPFNLACYYCQLGDLETAKDYLRRAFEIDSHWRLAALEDQDLKPLWSTLRAQVE
jgi:tetratricopeptide (TPR) repeat protein